MKMFKMVKIREPITAILKIKQEDTETLLLVA